MKLHEIYELDGIGAIGKGVTPNLRGQATWGTLLVFYGGTRYYGGRDTWVRCASDQKTLFVFFFIC